MRQPADKPAQETGIRIIEAENDFPFARVTQVVVGSAHAVTNKPDVEASLLALMQRLVERYHAGESVPAVEVQYKS